MTLMFDAAHKLATEQAIRVTIDDIDSLVVPLHALPPKYSIRQLSDGLIQLPISSQIERSATAAVLERCLRCRGRLVLKDDDPAAKQNILTWLIETIQPDGELFLDTHQDNENSAKVEKARAAWIFTSVFALKSIRFLKLYDLVPESNVAWAVLLSLLAFTQLGDTWNSKPAHEIAIDTLNCLSHEVQSEEFIVDYVLKTFLRPLFASSAPRTITPQGRKAPNGNLGDNAIKVTNSLDTVSKPWKYRDIYAVTVFKWVVSRVDEDLISKNWHLFIPPLLTLLDDPVTAVKSSGLDILPEFLGKISSRMLIQTGLGDLLEEALMPTLLFLPSLTPVTESLLLLRKGYAALFKLGDIRYALEDDKSGRNRFYDRVLREGIFYGVHHCGDAKSILELLLDEMSEVINRLHVYSIKHTKDILKLVSTVLTDPFAPSYPPLLLRGIKAAQSTILNCWPIVSEEKYHIQIVKALSICWINIADEIKNEPTEDVRVGLDQVKQELQISAALLCKSTEGITGQMIGIAHLIDVYPDLSNLFKSK